MDQKDSEMKKIDEYANLPDCLIAVCKAMDIPLIQQIQDLMIKRMLLTPPPILVMSNQRPGHFPVYDPHNQFGPYEPLPPLKSSDPALQLPVSSIHDHVEHHDFSRECEHEPIEVGFNISKVVCKKCDKVLPKEALYGKKIFQ